METKDAFRQRYRRLVRLCRRMWQRSSAEQLRDLPAVLTRPPEGVQEIRQVLERWRSSLPDL